MQDYASFIERIMDGPTDAVVLKIADLLDNLSPDRKIYTDGFEREDTHHRNALKELLLELDSRGVSLRSCFTESAIAEISEYSDYLF